jgi:hypothetical protein
LIHIVIIFLLRCIFIVGTRYAMLSLQMAYTGQKSLLPVYNPNHQGRELL